MRSSIRFLLSSFLLASVFSGRAGQVVRLGDIDSATVPADTKFRWMDAAGNVYSESYRTSYDYTQSTVVVDFAVHGKVFVGRLVAFNLKPNFAYQVKLTGDPGTDSGERLGYAGRWWREEWVTDHWGNGWNLNTKGIGYSPNPNDVDYAAQKDEPDATSPTGLKYKFIPYLLLGYFITDGQGNASVEFELRNSYHVLWRTDQVTRGANDGPTFDADITPAAASPAYDADGASKAVSIFGEWERLPVDGVFPAPGDYECDISLTEESFHEWTVTYAGFWAGAMAARIGFRVDDTPRFTVQPQSAAATVGDAVAFVCATDPPTGVTYRWLKDGLPFPQGVTAALSFPGVTLADAGVYECIASNAAGSAISSKAALAVTDALYTQGELDGAVTAAVAPKDAEIANLQTTIGSMYTQGELDAAVATAVDAAVEDTDGDGFTDEQEILRGSDPDRYLVTLSPGWNLVSLARIPDDNRIDSVFAPTPAGGHVHTTAWTWQGGAYTVTDRLEPLIGQWVFWIGDETEFDIALP